MPAKVSLTLCPCRPLSRQTAWGCFTSNLALPGSGSLVAGRRSGYAQLALTFIGFIATLSFGFRFIWWYFANHAGLADPETGPAKLAEMWPIAFWALLGIAIFALALLWALATSLQILREAKASESQNVPPKLS